MSYNTDRLGNHIEILSGYAYKSKDFVGTGIPVIKIKNVTPPCVSLEDLSYIPEEVAQKTARYFLHYDDVLIALTGSHINQMASVVGRVARVKYRKKTVLNQRVGKIIPLDGCDLDYVYYFLSQEEVKKSLASKAGGAANQANISPTDIKNLIIPFPDISIQRRISSILRAYDDLIETNQYQIKLLEEVAQRLYKMWFVDLRYPGYENVPMVDGVPEGWKRCILGSLFDVVRGKSYSSAEIAEGDGIKMVNLSNIRPFGGYIRQQEKSFSGKYKQDQEVNVHDLVMGVTDMTQEKRTVGRVALIPDLSEKAIISMDLIKLVPKEGSTLFYYALLLYGGYSEQVSQFSNGTNVLHLRPEALNMIDIILPNIQLQKLFVSKIEPIINRINALQKENILSAEARDRLLPKLMSGEIAV